MELHEEWGKHLWGRIKDKKGEGGVWAFLQLI